jgi:hypothetical protein
MEYFASWKKMKEEKVSAPGITNGQLKCIDPCSDAGFILSEMALLPFNTGYSPKIWRIGIDVMIPKNQHDLRPEKLSLILLLDARFNHNNKLIGKKFWNTEKREECKLRNNMAVEKTNHQFNMQQINA